MPRKKKSARKQPTRLAVVAALAFGLVAMVLTQNMMTGKLASQLSPILYGYGDSSSSGLCRYDTDCDDNNPCTTDKCSGSARIWGTCSNTPRETNGCCDSHNDCDFNPDPAVCEYEVCCLQEECEGIDTAGNPQMYQKYHCMPDPTEPDCTCGDGIIQNDPPNKDGQREQCDGGSNNDETAPSGWCKWLMEERLGHSVRAGYCMDDCTCTAEYCGDGTIQSPEECEGEDVSQCGTPPGGYVYICLDSCACRLCPENPEGEYCKSNADCAESEEDCDDKTCTCGGAAVCGDKRFAAGQEECDDSAGIAFGNAYCVQQHGPGYACVMEDERFPERNCTCSQYYCGNEQIDADLGEECEYSLADDPDYDADEHCKELYPPPRDDLYSYCEECTCLYCGDGKLHSFLGEECETAADCLEAYSDPDIDHSDTQCERCVCTNFCGNNIRENDEECDGNPVWILLGDCQKMYPDNIYAVFCNSKCVCEGCGDGIHQPERIEECDDGKKNTNASYTDPSAPPPCRPNCFLARCGDGIRDPALGEECDYGDFEEDGGVYNADTPPPGYSNWCGTNCKFLSKGQCCTRWNPYNPSKAWKCSSYGNQEWCESEIPGQKKKGDWYAAANDDIEAIEAAKTDCFMKCHPNSQRGPPGLQLVVVVGTGPSAAEPRHILARLWNAFMRTAFGQGAVNLHIHDIQIAFQTALPLPVREGYVLSAVLHFDERDRTYQTAFAMPEISGTTTVNLILGTYRIADIEHLSGNEYEMTLLETNSAQELVVPATFNIAPCSNSDDALLDCPVFIPDWPVYFHWMAGDKAGDTEIFVENAYHIFYCAGEGSSPVMSAELAAGTGSRIWGYEYTGNEPSRWDGQYFFSGGMFSAADDAQHAQGVLDIRGEVTQLQKQRTYGVATDVRLEFSCDAGLLRPEHYCGDGIQNEDEECDFGPYNSNVRPDACRTNCTLPRCGDGVVDTGEECESSDDCSEGGVCEDCQCIIL